jgi:alpha-1,2-mannosyltransferase
LLWALLTGLAVISFSVLTLARLQAPGADFACFWAGAKTALHAPDRLYDFDYISALQGWPLGPGRLRPYIYPPSALPFFIAFAWLPYWIGYGLWLLSTGSLFYWAGRRGRGTGRFVLPRSLWRPSAAR